MNEEVLNDLYNRAVSQGYTKSREDFISLIQTNDNVFNDMYSYVKSKGYQKDQNSFGSLIGRGGQPSIQQEQEQVQQPTLKKKEPSSMVSSLETTPSVSQEEPLRTTDYINIEGEAEPKTATVPYAVGMEPKPKDTEESPFLKGRGAPFENLRPLTEEEYIQQRKEAVKSGELAEITTPQGHKALIPTVSYSESPELTKTERLLLDAFGAPNAAQKKESKKQREFLIKKGHEFYDPEGRVSPLGNRKAWSQNEENLKRETELKNISNSFDEFKTISQPDISRDEEAKNFYLHYLKKYNPNEYKFETERLEKNKDNPLKKQRVEVDFINKGLALKQRAISAKAEEINNLISDQFFGYKMDVDKFQIINDEINTLKPKIDVIGNELSKYPRDENGNIITDSTNKNKIEKLKSLYDDGIERYNKLTSQKQELLNSGLGDIINKTNELEKEERSNYEYAINLKNLIKESDKYPELKKELIEDALKEKTEEKVWEYIPDWAKPNIDFVNGFRRAGTQLVRGLAYLPKAASDLTEKMFQTSSYNWTDQFNEFADEAMTSFERYTMPVSPNSKKNIFDYERNADGTAKLDKNGDKIEITNWSALPYQIGNGAGNLALFIGTSGVGTALGSTSALSKIGLTAGRLSKAGTFAMGYTMAAKNNYDDAKANGMTEDQATTYSLWKSPLDASVELIFPEQKLITPTINKSTAKLAAKYISQGVPLKDAILMSTKETLKNVAGENVEELTALAADYASKIVAEKATGVDFKIDDSLMDDIKNTVLVTSILTAPFGVVGSKGRKNQMENQSLFISANKPNEVLKNIGDLLDAKVINEAQARTATERVRIASESLKSIPENYSDDKKANILSGLVDKKILENSKKNTDPIFHDEINAKIKEKDEELKSEMNRPDNGLTLEENTEMIELTTKKDEGKVLSEQEQNRLNYLNNFTKEYAVQEQAQAIPDEIRNLKDDETVTFTVKSLDDIPEEFRNRASKKEGLKVEVRNTILGLPIGPKKTEVIGEAFTYSLTGKEAKDYAVQKQAAGQVPVQPTTGVGEKVEERKPETGPEVVTAEGEETIAPKEEVGQVTQFLVEGISADVGGYESYTEKKAGDLRNKFYTRDAKDKFTSSDGVEMQGALIERESKDGNERIITLGINETDLQGVIYDAVGRSAYYSVSVSVPKDSKTTAEDVKQMLVDKAAQIAKESKKQKPDLQGISASALRSTSKEVSMPKVEAKVEAEVKPTVLANVDATTTALESVPVEEKMDLEFTQEDGTVSPVNGNERMLSDMYHKAMALPEDQRTEPQKQVVSLVEQSLANEIEVERLERELAKPEVTEGPVTTVGISISNDTDIENLKNTARSKAQAARTESEKKSNETKVKILETAQRAIKAIKNIFPDIDIVIHDNEESYNNEVRRLQGKEGSGGNFAIITDANGKETRRIDINLSKANERTVAHETAHALLEKAFGDDHKLFQRFKDAVSKILSAEKNEELNKFIERYTNKEVRPEEYLAELTGMLEQQETTLSIKPSTLQKIAELINKFVSAITNGKFVPFRNVKDTKEIVEFLNTVSGAIREGKEVSLEDINTLGLSGQIQSKDVKSKSSLVSGEIKRFPVNPNVKLNENVPLSDFDGKTTNLIESDRMVGGFISDSEGKPMFKFFGGVYYPIITGKWWASRNITKAKAIAENGNKNRDKDGYIYSSPMIGSDKQHMSNNDMLFATIELMKNDVSDPKSKVKKNDVIDSLKSAFNRIDLQNKKSVVKDILKKSNDINSIFNELEFILFQDGDKILGRDGKEILDKDNKPISNFTFEQRLSIIETVLGDPKVKEARFPSAGSITMAAKRFEEPITEKAKAIGDMVVIFRTKGNLEYKESDKNDPFYHKSYPVEIRAVDSKGNPAEIEVYVLDAAYSMKDVLPKLKKSTGGEFSWDEYISKHKKEKLATAQYNRTAKLSSAAGQIKSKSQQPEPTPAPKYVRDISVLITPATVRGFDTRTERIKDMSIKYDELVKEYATDKSEEKRIQIKELEDQILNDAQQEIIDEVNKIPGLAVKFEQPRIGLWDGAFEPSFNMTFSVTPQADTKKISDLLMEFGEKYSQDAFILETQSEQHNDFVNGKIRMPLNEEDSNGLANYPQIIYTFAQPISDEKISELSTSLQANGIDAFSVNNNELKISVLTFLSEEQEQTLSKDEQYAEKFRDFESKSRAAAASVGDVLGSNENATLDIRIKKSHYQGANKFEKTDKTRQYDRRDVLKPFQQGTTEVEALSKEFAELRKKQIEGKKLTEQEQARFNELESIIQPVVEKTFETNKKIYEQAKSEIEDIAEKSIEDFDASISPFPIKRPQRASVKTLRWYSGLTENLGDGARVNVIVKTDADADALFDKINEENPVGNDKDLRRINEETDLSYPKRLIEVRTPSGVIAEMQVITEKAYLAKDGMKGFTGGKEQQASANKELNNVRSILGWNIPDGLGHYFYEIQRDTNIDQDLRDEAKRLSNLYYDAFVNENSDLKETPFMNDVMKFKERVDKADKKNWDKGNEGKAPESLMGYKVKSKSSLAGKDINNVIKRGRAAGVSERAIRTVLKKQGFTDAEIDAAMGAEKGAAKKVTVSEEMLPGFNRMMEQVDGIVAKSRERGVSEDKVMENVMRYVEGSKAYENASDVQREQIIRDIEKRFGVKQKAAPKAEKIIGTIKDTKKVTMSEKDALVKQIKDQARGAKDAKSAMRRSLDFVSRTVKELARSGKISVKQAANVLRKFSSINPLSKESVDRFVDYMSKVFADADYSNKLSFALKTKSDISKLSKNKDKDANLRALGEKFAKIDPSMVENIDEYNEMASAIKESIKGSTYRREAVMPAQMVNIQNAMEYVNKAMDAQKKKMTEIKAAEIQEMMGVDVSDLSYDQMMQMLESKEPITKYNEGIIRGTIEKMFNVYSSIINQIIDSGIDPMTGDSVDIKTSKKMLVKKFMEMDLSTLTPKEALQAVDALNNFLVNKSTAKMQTVLSNYTGEMMARRLNAKGVVAKTLKMYWSSSVGRFFGEQFTALPLLIERMFKGVIAGANVEKAMGLTELKNKKAEAENRSNRIVEEYINKFYKSKSNGEAFDTEANVTERGMAAFMSRSVTGTEEEMQQDFNRRKKLIEESIEALSKGSEKEQAKAKLYKQAYDKILKDSNSVEDVRRNTDKNNLAAIDFWVENWSSIYDELADVSENVYNKILDKDVNYTPDRFSRLERAKEKTELSNDESVFHGNTNSLYKKETGVLMRAERPESLPTDDKGKKPMMYIDLSFDMNNANSMYDAMVDINTAAPIRQIEAFVNSDAFDSLVPEVKDARILKERIQLYVRNIRGKNIFENDTFAMMMRKLNTISAIGVGQALGGILQPLKQTIPVAMNTLINAGGLDIGSVFSQSKMAFIDNSGYSIANRGIESQTQLKSINKLMDLAAESKGIKALKFIEKANKIWLDIFLVKPDVFVARASWMSYYEQSLKKQGIDPSGIDYSTHKLNKEAADYAQSMVDRQQNISDSDLQGKMFSSKKSLNQLFVKTLLPFANFRINQYMRLSSDVATLTSMTSSKEDRIIAARSLSGFGVEMATFSAISIGAAYLLGSLSKWLMGEEEDDEEEEKRLNNIIKGRVTGIVTDLISPLPIFDKPIAAGVNMGLDKVQDAMDIAKEDKLSIFGDTKTDMAKSLGTLGISIDRVSQLYELFKLSSDGEYTDDYGNKKKISDENMEYLQYMTGVALLTNIGLAPSEANTVVRNSVRDAKAQGKTEKTVEREQASESKVSEERSLLNELMQEETDDEVIDAINKRIGELDDTSEERKEKNKAKKEEKKKLLKGYESMSDMKRYNPELYEETFGKDSPYYEKYKDDMILDKKLNKLRRKIKDEEEEYVPQPRKRKKKEEGGFGSQKFGGKKFGEEGVRQSTFGTQRFGK